MRKKKINCMETLAIYLAERSVNKSIPYFAYKVDKPKNIENIIKENFNKR